MNEITAEIFPFHPLPRMKKTTRKEVFGFMETMQAIFGLLPSAN